MTTEATFNADHSATAYPDVNRSAVPQGDVIVVDDIWKTYDMGSEQQVHALQGISLSIKHNEYVAIMAPRAPASRH